MAGSRRQPRQMPHNSHRPKFCIIRYKALLIEARMARPREFDHGAALDAAMDCFWRDGYEATSVRDLAASMGITGTSLYNAYGDKRTLFGHALRRYTERSTRERIARLASAL